MIIRNLETQTPFATKDGSTIRSILDCANAPVQNQSLAEAQLPTGCATEPHYHKLSEEFYFILKGEGTMTVSEKTETIREGDAVLIPAGEWHTLRANRDLRFLCCCAPAYAHEDTYFE